MEEYCDTDIYNAHNDMWNIRDESRKIAPWRKEESKANSDTILISTAIDPRGYSRSSKSTTRRDPNIVDIDEDDIDDGDDLLIITPHQSGLVPSHGRQRSSTSQTQSTSISTRRSTTESSSSSDESHSRRMAEMEHRAQAAEWRAEAAERQVRELKRTSRVPDSRSMKRKRSIDKEDDAGDELCGIECVLDQSRQGIRKTPFPAMSAELMRKSAHSVCCNSY
jgi:hypothetical protein